MQNLTEPIVAHYTCINFATAAALENFIPPKKFNLNLRRIDRFFSPFVHT